MALRRLRVRGVGLEGELNDLWKYDGTNWAWVSGASATNQLGVYGTKGVAAPSNAPGARHNHVAWSNGAGTIWLFGGAGIRCHRRRGLPERPVEVGRRRSGPGSPGSTGVGQFGNYGTKGVPAPTQRPRSAAGRAIAWRDASGEPLALRRLRLLVVGQRQPERPVEVRRHVLDLGGGQQPAEPAGIVRDQGGRERRQRRPAGGRTPTRWMDDAGELWLFGGEGLRPRGPMGIPQRSLEVGRHVLDLDRRRQRGRSARRLRDHGGARAEQSTRRTGRRRGLAGDPTATSGSSAGSGTTAPTATSGLSDLWKWDGTDWIFIAAMQRRGRCAAIYGGRWRRQQLPAAR